MTHLRHSIIALTIAAGALCVPAFAQQDAGPPRPKAAAPPAGAPKAGAAASENAEDAASAPAPIIESNPAVREALERPRKEPADYFEAVIWLLNLDRPELAKPILEELAKLPLTDAQRAALVEKFGPQSMLQLAKSQELAPTGAAVADACMNAAAASSNDPKRLTTLIAQLADPSPETRLLARHDIAVTGQVGVVATLEALAQETDAGRRGALVEAVSEMHPLAVGPLTAMLDTRDPQLQTAVADLLHGMRAPQATPLLPQPAGSAELALAAALRDYGRGMLPFAADASNQVELWQWNDATKKLSSVRYPADEARIIWMDRLARELARFVPNNPVYARQAMLLQLEAAALAPSGAPAAAPAELATTSANELEQLLAAAEKLNFAHAAVAVVNSLGARGDSSVVQSGDGKPTPLVRALDSPNRRVRFAALRAIMTLDPQSPYAGSSRVPETLGWFAADTGQHRALVAMRTTVAASELAGLLNGDQLATEATDRGREAVDLALKMPDLEMIFVDLHINSPDIRQVLYELRISPTTAEIPIAILAPSGRLAAAESLAAEHTRVIAVTRPSSAETVSRLVARLSALSGRFVEPAETRTAEAVEAITWLSKLADGSRPFYKIRRTEPVLEAALYGTTSAGPAIAALSQLNSPEGQVALINYASQPTLPIAGRSQAADAFRKNVAAHGLLLKNDQILNQYARYNASEHADADTQQVLGAVLDAIESRRAPGGTHSAAPSAPASPPDESLPAPPQP